MKILRYAFLSVVTLTSSCATPQPLLSSETSEPIGACLEKMTDLDSAVRNADVEDAQYTVLESYPYLRVNRLLVALKSRIETPEQWRSWLQHSSELAREARTIEWQNLPVDVPQQWGGPRNIDRCRQLLVDALGQKFDDRNRVLEQATVDDEYKTWRRVVGIYAIGQWFIRRGVKRMYEEYDQTFATPLEELPQEGTLVRFIPKATQQNIVVDGWGYDAIGMPQIPRSTLDGLFSRYAPAWEVDVVNDSDRIGYVRWDDGVAVVDISKPVVYQLLSYTIFDGRVLPQLVYLAWFPERSKRGSFDIYAGKFDGVFWRVTLDERGEPLLYDSVHSCGCYHKFFRTPAMMLKADTNALPEPPYVAQTLSTLNPAERWVLRISAIEHYVQRVYAGDALGGQVYTRRSYNQLRSLPYGERGSKSLFGPDAFISGSERMERWILWPSGVVSPGAMRQWGRHPIAFVGRRHLDDPYLIDQLFQRH